MAQILNTDKGEWADFFTEFLQTSFVYDPLRPIFSVHIMEEKQGQASQLTWFSVNVCVV